MNQWGATGGRPDYYALLGVAADADREAIRAAYRALAKEHHPDLAGGEESRSAGKFLQIQEAYDVLRDTARRAQYDLERARREAIEEARRQQRDLAGRHARGPVPPGIRAAMRPPPAFHPRQKPAATNLWFYVGAIFLVVATVGLIVGQQRLNHLAAKQDQMTIVRVDGPRRPGPQDGSRRGESLPPGLSALSKEMAELARLRASRAEAARRKAEPQAEGQSAEKKTAATSTSSSLAPGERPSTDANRKVDCAGEGRTFFVVHQNDIVSVSYNGGPLVRPVINDQGTGMVVVSMVEPTNRISIGFMRGDKDRTVVLISDAVGNVFRTFGVDCSAAAF